MNNLLIFVQSPNPGTYINVITHCVCRANVRQIYFACKQDVTSKRVDSIEFIKSKIRGGLETYFQEGGLDCYGKALKVFPSSTQIDSRIIWLSFVNPHESIESLKQKFDCDDLIVDITACSRRLSVDIVASFLANGINHVSHFELADVVYSKQWPKSRMYHDLASSSATFYYAYDDFSLEGSTSLAISASNAEKAGFVSTIAERSVSLLSQVSQGVKELAKEHLQRYLFSYFVLQIVIWCSLASLGTGLRSEVIGKTRLRVNFRR